jgi:hypothetical protein
MKKMVVYIVAALCVVLSVSAVGSSVGDYYMFGLYDRQDVSLTIDYRGVIMDQTQIEGEQYFTRRFESGPIASGFAVSSAEGDESGAFYEYVGMESNAISLGHGVANGPALPNEYYQFMSFVTDFSVSKNEIIIPVRNCQGKLVTDSAGVVGCGVDQVGQSPAGWSGSCPGDYKLVVKNGVVTDCRRK